MDCRRQFNGIVILQLLCATLLPPGVAQESRIELRSYRSTILNGTRYYNVFLPEGYSQETARYPVVYLFRGHEREWANPTEDASRRGTIKTVFDRLFLEGRIGKMILVMPGLGVPPSANEFGYVLDELIPHIDSLFRTLPTRLARGADGFSYGGYDLLELLWRDPDAFITAGSYDGSFWASDLTRFQNAPASYWDRLRQVTFLLHSLQPGAGNWSSNVSFISILTAHGARNTFDTLSLGAGAQHNWYFADLHMERALPLHWGRFTESATNLPVALYSPLPGTPLAGTVPVRWSAPGSGVRRTLLERSNDGGRSWRELLWSASPDSAFTWNTHLDPDGVRYLLRVSQLGDTVYGSASSGGRLVVNNPGNAPPEVELMTPGSGEAVGGLYEIHWWTGDADGDSPTTLIEVRSDAGEPWRFIAGPLTGERYVWDSRSSANSSEAQFRVTASDGVTTTSIVSPPFTIRNNRGTLPDTSVAHVAGSGDGRVRIAVTNPALLTGHRYAVEFDQGAGGAVYDVTDLNRGAEVLGSTAIGSAAEGPEFDGIRLRITDYRPPRPALDSTRWTTGSSTILPLVALPTIDPGTGQVTGFPYGADYEVRISGAIADTSSSAFGWTPAPMRFTVWNLSEGRKVKPLFTDLDGDGEIDLYDDLILTETDSLGRPFLTWEMFFGAGSAAVAPAPGDRFLLRILKPLGRGDRFEFVADPAGVLAVPGSQLPTVFRLDQNYPNPFNPSTTIRFSIPSAGRATMTVHDILGREVGRIVDGPLAAGSHSVHFDGSGLASGVYFCTLQSGAARRSIRLLLLR